MSDFDWEHVLVMRSLEDDLQQGDLVKSCVDGDWLYPEMQSISHFIVVSQTCDLARQHSIFGSPDKGPKYRSAILAPCFEAGKFLNRFGPKKSVANLAAKSTTSRVFRWNHPVYSYLPAFENSEPKSPELILSVEELYPFRLVTRRDGKPSLENYARLRSHRVCGLNSPWRERLGWNTGALFARTATPDASAEEAKKQAEKVIQGARDEMSES